VAKLRGQALTANPHSNHGVLVKNESQAIAALRDDHHDF